MSMQQSNKHEFALYYSSISVTLAEKVHTEWLIQDKELVHRIENVIRLKANDRLILFNAHLVVHGTMLTVTSKKYIVIRIDRVIHPYLPTPPITVLLPLLKRDDFETTLAELTVLGVNTIVPMITAKSRSSLGIDRERMTKIMQSAAEQSKQFIFPTIYEAVNFEAAVDQYVSPYAATIRIFFDPEGTSVNQLLPSLAHTTTTRYILAIGPEGDMNTHEKQVLHNNNFHACALTPTVLRAQQAIFLGAGIIRSWYTSKK